LLYQQAFRETFEHEMEESRLRIALERIATQKILDGFALCTTKKGWTSFKVLIHLFTK